MSSCSQSRMGQETVWCKTLLYVAQTQRHWDPRSEMSDSHPQDWDFSELTPARPANSGLTVSTWIFIMRKSDTVPTSWPGVSKKSRDRITDHDGWHVGTLEY